MKILYDGYIFGMQSVGGISRYFSNIIDRLPVDVAPTLTSPSRGGNNFPKQPRLDLRYCPQFGFWPGRVAHLTARIYFRLVSRGFDIVHPTYYAFLMGLPWNAKALRGRLVVTVYDLIHERYSGSFRDGYVATKPDAIRAAAAVLCISKQTRDDLLHYYPEVDPAKVHVTYLASEITREMAEGPQQAPEEPYVLFVGARTAAYKNFDGLMHAFAAIATEHKELILCAVGGSPFSDEELALAARLGIKDRLRYLGNLDDHTLAKVYRSAQVFVYPSLYEGFGIPPLEAMNCGVPVIVANRSSLPEVVGSAAFCFDPEQPGDFESGLARILNSSALRKTMIENGYEQASRFSWADTAGRTVEIYRRLANAR